MKREGQNEYEQAFESCLAEAKVRFARVDQTHRCVLHDSQTKTFDYLIYLKGSGYVLVELKGRLFRGQSLARRTGLQCWVSAEDITALGRWQQRFACEQKTAALFVFAYRIEHMSIENDGLDVYDYDGRRYVFLCIRYTDYQRRMKVRSPRWKTVTLSAGDFRALCFPAERIWLGEQLQDE
jgi:hypothetical protein